MPPDAPPEAALSMRTARGQSTSIADELAALVPQLEADDATALNLVASLLVDSIFSEDSDALQTFLEESRRHVDSPASGQCWRVLGTVAQWAARRSLPNALAVEVSSDSAAGRMLTFIRDHPECASSDVVSALGLAGETVSRAGRKLLRNRLVTQTRPGRFVRWQITDYGVAVAQRWQQASPRVGAIRPALDAQVERLIDSAIRTRRTDSSSAADAVRDLETALTLARSSEDPRLEARCTEHLAITARYARDSRRALYASRQLGELGTKLGDQVLVARGLYETTRSALLEPSPTGEARSERMRLCVDDLHKAKALLLNARGALADDLAWVSYSLGECNRRLGDFHAAHSHISDALNLFATAGSLYGECATRRLLCLVLRIEGRYDESRDQARRSLDIAETRAYRRLEADALVNIALLDICEARYSSAVPQLDKALILYRHLSSRSGEALALSSHGVIQFERGQVDDAADNFRRALDLSREQNLVEAEALNYFRLGIVYLHLDDLRSADDHFREATYLCRPGSEGRFEALTYRALAAHRAGRGHDARRYLGDSVLGRRPNEPSIEVPARASLASDFFEYLSSEYELGSAAATAEPQLVEAKRAAVLAAPTRLADEPAAWQLSTIGWFEHDS